MRRRILVFALGFLTLLGVAGLRAVDPLPLEMSRLKAFDLYQQTAPVPYAPAPVRVVDIDEASLAELGQWPWPRTVLARMLERMTEAGAAAVVFDVVFSEPDRTSPRRLAELWPETETAAILRRNLERLPDHDDVFAGAISGIRTVGGFLVTRGEGDGTGERPPPPRKAGMAHAGTDPLAVVPGFDGAVRNLPALEESMTGLGVLSLVPEVDNIVRRVPMLVGYAGQLYPALAIESLRVATGASTVITRSVDASGEVAAGQTGLVDLKVGPFTVPLTRDGRLWVRYGEPAPQRTVSAAWVVRAPAAELRMALEGTIVLVGTSAPGLRDLRATPLRAAEPGVEIHARIVEQILAGDFLARPDWALGAELLALAVAGGLVVLAAPFVGALWGALLALASAAAVLGGSWAAFAEASLLLDPVTPMLAVVVAYLVVSTAQYLLTERERERVRSAFGQYLSPAMVERLARDAKSLRLGGEVRELTLLFLDLRGFTSLSERMSAEEITHFLNDFLTPMTEAVMDSGGTVDKYMGDALMAFWNAPLDQPDHAERACRAALDMRRRFAALRERAGDPNLGIGIGLNLGPANVGNMGSAQRFDYSAIGDAVNTASRLEGLCKAYGVDLIAGEPVRAAAPGFAWLPLDRVRVVGKSEPVTIHTLLAERPDAGIEALAAAQEAALAAYRAREWEAARIAFSAASLKAPGWLQPLYAAYARRIDALEADPPGPDWDGVYDAQAK